MVFSPTDNLKRQPVFSVVCGIINLLELYLNESSDIRRGFSSIGSSQLLHETVVRTCQSMIINLVRKRRDW